LAATHLGWISSELKESPKRQKHFVESVAVGQDAFIKSLQTLLGVKARGKKNRQLRTDEYYFRETIGEYGDDAPPKTDELKMPWDNTFPWVSQQ